jgi:signal transduction histidine kinase
MVHLHEEERRRLSRELHDETAQVFAAVNLELGALHESVPDGFGPRLDRARGLVETGIRGIRNLTRDLRPPLLDDLGLLPALRALVGNFRNQGDLEVTLDASENIPPMPKESELALYRALQEALSNVVRHSDASRVEVYFRVEGETWVSLEVRDNGKGLHPKVEEGGGEHMGLTGMRERFSALGGRVLLRNSPEGGAVLTVDLPIGPLPDG